MKFYKSTLALAVCGLLAACGSDSGTKAVDNGNTDNGNNGGGDEVALVIHMIGDSTMAEYAEDRRPQMGWGEQLDMFFDDSTEINNYAAGGRSSLSYYYEDGKWNTVKSKLAEGDYVIIQFAHNDQKNGDAYDEYGTYAYCDDGSTTLEGAEGCANADHSYYLNLKKYVEEAREQGANPILVSPIVRGYWDGAEISEKGQHNLTDVDTSNGETYARGNYVQAMKDVAAQYNVPYVDLTDATKEIVEYYGQSGAAQYLWCNDQCQNGSDTTHPVELFATLIAKEAADGISANDDLTDVSEHIVAASSIIANPSALEFSEQYIGVEKSKSLSVSAFDLDPAAGTMTLTAPEGFQLSDSNDVTADGWNTSYEIAYTNGAFTETLYAKFAPTAEKEYAGSITLDASTGTEAEIAVSGKGVAAPAGLPTESNWFTGGKSDLAGYTDGTVTVSDVTMSDGLVAAGSYYDSDKTVTVDGEDVTVARVRAGFDYSEANYLEFKLTVNNEVFNVTEISAYLSKWGTGNIRADIAYSTSADFSNPVTLATELDSPRDDLQFFSFEVTEQLEVGESIYLRIYPWMKSASDGGRQLGLYNVSINGFSGE